MDEPLPEPDTDEGPVLHPWAACGVSLVGTIVLAAIYGALQRFVEVRVLELFVFSLALVGLTVSVSLLAVNRDGPSNPIKIGLWGAFSGGVFAYVQWMTHASLAGDGGIIWTPAGLWSAMAQEATSAATGEEGAPPEGLLWALWSLEALIAVLWGALAPNMATDDGLVEGEQAQAQEDDGSPPALGPPPSYVTLERTAEGLVIQTHIPWFIILIRLLFGLGLVGSLTMFLVGRLEVQLPGPLEEVGGWLFLLLFAGLLLHALILHASDQQFVRSEQLRWGPDQLEFRRRGAEWQVPRGELVAFYESPLGEKRSRLPVKNPPRWEEYAVGVETSSESQDWFRSSHRGLVTWVVAALTAELGTHGPVPAPAPASPSDDGDSTG